MKTPRLTVALALALSACSGAQLSVDDGGGTHGEGGGDDELGPVCGNGVLEGAEVCDGADLGELGCADVDGFIGGTLGCAMDCHAYDTSSCEGDPSGALVRFNEVTASEVAAGPYAGGGDAIELYNAGAEAADLAGFQVSDDPSLPADKTYAFPSGTTLAPGQWIMIVKRDDATGEGDYPFGISSSSDETLTLADPAGSVVDSVGFAGPDAEVSWCRIPDGEGAWTSCAQTFGSANVAGGPEPVCGNAAIEADEACDGTELGGLSCPDVGAFVGGVLACTDACQLDTTGCELDPNAALVVINELTSADTEDIELYNAGAQAVDLSGYILTDDVTNVADPYDPDADDEELVFSDGTTIEPGGFLVVTGGPRPGHPFGLSGGGDAVTLLDPGLTVIDHVAYGVDEALVSYCRLPDGPDGAWQADCTPTFGAANEG